MGQANPWTAINQFATSSINSDYLESDVKQYLELQAEASDIEAKKKLLRDKILGQVGPDSEAGSVWHYGGAKLEMCKGRISKKLDRKQLVLAGITKDVLDDATVTTEGNPSLRITVDRDNGAASKS